MGYKGLQGLQRVTRGNGELQWMTRGNMGLEAVTRGYRGITEGYKRLQVVK